MNWLKFILFKDYTEMQKSADTQRQYLIKNYVLMGLLVLLVGIIVFGWDKFYRFMEMVN